MSRCVLPIGWPPVIGYLHHAFPLAIVSLNTRYLPWFYGQYIQLHCPENLSDGPDEERKRKFNFYRHPCYDDMPVPGLSVSRLHRDVVLAQGTIIDFIRRTVSAGMYVQISVDEFEIPGKKAYRKRHLSHELLVYGFCDQTQSVMTLGFNAMGDFGPLPVCYVDLVRAFETCTKDTVYDPERLEVFQLDTKCPWVFDLQCVTESLDDYVHSRNSSNRFRMIANPIDGIFGLATYDSLIETYQKLDIHPEWFDIRPIHILWEHKKCMLARIQYLETEGYLDLTAGFGKRYEMIEGEVRIARMMMLKVRVLKDVAILKRVLKKLQNLIHRERDILICVHDHLASHNEY